MNETGEDAMLEQETVREPLDGQRPELKVIEREPTMANATAAQTLIDAVTQLEANKKDVTPKGFQRRLQLAYAIYDQASRMVGEIESQHAKLVSDLVAVERRSPLPEVNGGRR
jgi:hypothetical protein